MIRSQSLVNQGRFPLVGEYWELLLDNSKSQSLVNQGRFPQNIKGGGKMYGGFMSQSLVNQGRFPLLRRVIDARLTEEGWSQSLVNEGRFPQKEVGAMAYLKNLMVAIPR